MRPLDLGPSIYISALFRIRRPEPRDVMKLIDLQINCHQTYRRSTSWFWLWFWRNHCNADAMVLSQCAYERHSPPENFENGGRPGGVNASHKHFDDESCGIMRLRFFGRVGLPCVSILCPRCRLAIGVKIVKCITLLNGPVLETNDKEKQRKVSSSNSSVYKRGKQPNHSASRQFVCVVLLQSWLSVRISSWLLIRSCLWIMHQTTIREISAWYVDLASSSGWYVCTNQTDDVSRV
jgi:hypothetical protein